LINSSPQDTKAATHASSQTTADPGIQVVITTGGTGVTGRDGTPEAVSPLLDKIIDGFGEVFRAVSLQQIRTSTIQSRALAGVANGTYVFCVPGSAGACATAWDDIINAQLDYRTRPCNLVELMPRLLET
jgi:molybdenum cofactor biosynthesis protein B